MKTLKFGFIIFTILIFGIVTSTCTRTSVDDPAMTGYAGYQVILSGTAHPSTLFIPQGTGWVTSRITMRATLNSGAPFGEGRIMLKINEDFGQFENDKDYAFINLNTQGIGWVRYKVNRLERQEIGASQLINIYAVLQDDNRLDSEGSLIYDYIPIKLVTDFEAADTFTATIISNPDTDTSDDDIDLTAPLSADVSFSVQLCNSTGTNPISYQVAISGTAGLISSPLNGTTGTADDTCTIETITIDSTVATLGDTASISFIAGSTTITIDITIN